MPAALAAVLVLAAAPALAGATPAHAAVGGAGAGASGAGSAEGGSSFVPGGGPAGSVEVFEAAGGPPRSPVARSLDTPWRRRSSPTCRPMGSVTSLGAYERR